MVAVMVIVTVPPAGMAPFQVTVLVPTVATAVPLVAVAETRVSAGGQDVDELVARVVGLGARAAVGERDGVGHGAARR